MTHVFPNTTEITCTVYPSPVVLMSDMEDLVVQGCTLLNDMCIRTLSHMTHVFQNMTEITCAIYLFPIVLMSYIKYIKLSRACINLLKEEVFINDIRNMMMIERELVMVITTR